MVRYRIKRVIKLFLDQEAHKAKTEGQVLLLDDPVMLFVIKSMAAVQAQVMRFFIKCVGIYVISFHDSPVEDVVIFFCRDYFSLGIEENVVGFTYVIRIGLSVFIHVPFEDTICLNGFIDDDHDFVWIASNVNTFERGFF